MAFSHGYDSLLITVRWIFAQAGPPGDAIEVAVPAGISRLFAHPVLDWGMSSLTQQQLIAREVRSGIEGGRAAVEYFER